jgi:DNA-directed RNA polymerase sigma subunit (sigma70/sigma32)
MARKSVTLSKTSEKKLASFLKQNQEYITETFEKRFREQVMYDIKNIRECSEKKIVDFYCEIGKNLLTSGEVVFDDAFFNKLKTQVRSKLSQVYTGNKSFDNNIDIYFNEVKSIYIKNPQNESDELEFIPENRDIFIKNNLKLVIECAKRYRDLGLPFEDLIQIGNYGLLVAFDKFDTERANLRKSIINDIKKSVSETFSKDDAEAIIRKNFTYSKNLEQTIDSIPEEGFESKDAFIEWSKVNIKTAVFASVAFQWIRANIIIELNKYGKILKIPNSVKKDLGSTSIIRLDSINPHTDDCYHDNQMADYINEFTTDFEAYEDSQQQELYKETVDDLLMVLNSQERRIIKKKFGIDYPYEMDPNNIAESEGLPVNKVKQIINSSLKKLSTEANKNGAKSIFI